MTKEEWYIGYLSGHGDFDDWYDAIIAHHYDNKSFEELDLDNQLYVCMHFEKDYLERD